MTLGSKPEGIELQGRDLELLRGLYESRVMTLAHAATLYFDGKSEAAKKRVQKLKSAGFISERPRRVYEPSILALTRGGNDILGNHGLLSAYPPLTGTAVEKRARVSEMTLRHELEVMDVKVAVVAAIRQTDRFRVNEFSTWPLLSEVRSARPDGIIVTVKPDGFIRIGETNVTGNVFELTFFLEVDRSTETQDTVALKAACYRDYYRSGRFAAKNGLPQSQPDCAPFRVLMVFRNAERRNNAAEGLLLLSPPILTQAWLTTFTEIATNPLGPIWVRPADYRAIVRDTPFDVLNRYREPVYRRQSQREAFVEEGIRKCALLAGNDV